MSFPLDSIPPLLLISPRIAVLPVIHGSAQFSLTVRNWLLENDFDCLAVPLPPSFQDAVEQAVVELPRPSIVVQSPTSRWQINASDDWQSDNDDDSMPTSDPVSYVPIDPCQPVVMGIRAAIGEHLPRRYIDLETDPFCPCATVMPDPFAVRHVSPEKFAAALLPSITRPSDEQTRARILHMAIRLAELEKQFQRILLIANVLHWPWIREAYNQWQDQQRASGAGDSEDPLPIPEHDVVSPPVHYAVNPKTLTFLLGELPFITSLYERARLELEEDADLQIDGVKELLIAARDHYREDLGNRARRITPLLLSKCLTYIRNLSLIHRRMTPDLYTIVTASQQILGDQFALHVAELASRYRFDDYSSDHSVLESLSMGIDQATLPDGDTVSLVNRLPGPPITWRTCHLKRRPTDPEKQRWRGNWNPYSQCSYPPEDDRIENFRTRVFDRAQAIVGNDLARTEKFTTSVKDGIDIRDTLRHWYEKQIYVKVIPPSRGTLDACVMLFDSPADPRDYPWRITWFAEHEQESTLALFGTDFREELVGPGIGLSVYGGALFLYPPIAIRDVWTDPRLDYTETLEERLLAAACMHSRSPQIALLSALPPGQGWRKLAKRHRKHLVHVPLASFSDEQVQQLRMVHVLNGSQVRSYAADFIRKV